MQETQHTQLTASYIEACVNLKKTLHIWKATHAIKEYSGIVNSVLIKFNC